MCCSHPSSCPAQPRTPRERRGRLSPHRHLPELPPSGRTARGRNTDRHNPTEAHPHLPPKQQTRGAGRAGSVQQDGGWAGTDPATGQPRRPAERNGREARPSPEPCGKRLPRLTCSPGRARRPRRLPPVCRGPAARCPLAAALALPLATAAPLPPRPARRLARRRTVDGALRHGCAGAIGWRRGGGRDSAVPMARAPVSQAEDGDWRRGYRRRRGSRCCGHDRAGPEGAAGWGQPRLQPPPQLHFQSAARRRSYRP